LVGDDMADAAIHGSSGEVLQRSFAEYEPVAQSPVL
jgi:hypothetical protein